MVSLVIDEKLFKQIATIIIVSVLVILTFFILKPILISTVFGLILAFIFYPIYKRLNSKIKNSNLSALIICIALITIILLPLFFLIPIFVKQTFEAYNIIRQTDFLSSFRTIFSTLFSSQEISNDMIVSINAFASNIASSFFNSFTDVLLNSPTIILNIALIIFIFFFGLRDGEKFVSYLQDLSPLSKESEKKVLQQFKDITYAVIFGQIIIGLAQGIVTGIGLFIFGVPNALILALLAIFFSILPMIGPWLVWVPVDIYLFLEGKTGAALGLLIYGLLVISWIDNLIRMYIVSKRTKINSAVILVSMVGGLLMFGVLGLILGPLIVSYLLLFLEFYRNKKSPGLIEISKPIETK